LAIAETLGNQEIPMNQEQQRLEAAKSGQVPWKKWGPYLSERQWGTVREDYSATGTAWDYFPHDQARSRAYRWGEDGLAGLSDNQQRLCLGLALWNGQDAILKERLFGLAGSEGNHGEDVKEYYFYLDSTPTHSYMKFLYKYPQAAFPYAEIVQENRQRSRREPEFELLETGVFAEDRYFDVVVEYAKAGVEDILMQISITNRGPETKPIYVLPTLWFRNTWSWKQGAKKPSLKGLSHSSQLVIESTHPDVGQRWLFCQQGGELLFTENETNVARLFNGENSSPYVKDGINEYVVHGQHQAVNPDHIGTKASAYYQLEIGAGETQTIRLRLTPNLELADPLGEEFAKILQARHEEADHFYQEIVPSNLDADQSNIFRQALAGMLWSKQYYNYEVEPWLEGDSTGSKAPQERKRGRNRQWGHLAAEEILSMPDTWEYPWFAAWDLAFHALPLAIVDSEFAKQQLDIITREWYMHPNGQLPAYEWAFSDVNPPVHAWATWRVYKMEQKRTGKGDRTFLERVFQKLLLNFTWWVNRKDREGKNVFEGGFLGLDNIGVFDRSTKLPTGGYIEQADGTSWMGMYCLDMLTIALELARENPVYEDIATKFFEHFIYIADAMNKMGSDGTKLWDEEDGFYYDVLQLPNDQQFRMKVRSMVGLIPLFAVATLEPDLLELLPGFKGRLEWFMTNRPQLTHTVASLEADGTKTRRLLAICNREKLQRILSRMLDEQEFLSEYGIRSLSRYHQSNPYVFNVNGEEHRVDYEPAESSSGLFGGNSNWRGPVWFPVNYLLIESLQKFHHYWGDEFKVECPTGSGRWLTLWEVSLLLSQRLTSIFTRNAQQKRPVYGGSTPFQSDPHWQDLILFYEYFHGDNGAGIGASHQTGWTGLVAKLIQQSNRHPRS
jgi:hypothetical protein